MLNSMRGSGQSKSMWVIMGLLMFGLTFGFGLDSLRGANVTQIGSVGEEPIELNTYGRAYQSAIRRVSQQIGRAPTAEEMDLFGIQKQVLGAVTAQAALDNETAKLGLSVGDDLVRNSIRSSAQFQNINGIFDNESYRYFLENQVGMSAGQFETRVRKENARRLLQDTIVSGVSSDETLALTLVNFSQQERSFEWAALDSNDLAAPVAEPTKAELETFYTAHKFNYMTPQTREITYAWLNPADLLDIVDIDEIQIRDSYDLQFDRFNRAEQRAIDRLVFPSMAEAQAARDRVDTSEATFAEIVSERGLSEADINLGEVSRDNVSAAAANLLFNQTKVGVVGPVDSFLGPALFRINAVIEADNTPFDEVRDELRTELAGESARRLVADLVDEIADELAAGVELEELTKFEGLQVAKIKFHLNSDHPIAGYGAFRAAANAAQVGDFSEILDLSDGGVFALRLDNIVEPTQIIQTDVGLKLVEDFKAVRMKEALLELAERFRPGLESGGNLDIVNVDLSTVTNINRTSFIEVLPSEAISKVFEMNLGDVSVIESDGTVILVRLIDIADFDPDREINVLTLKRVKQQIDAQISLDILNYYTDALETESGVLLNRNIINQVNLQMAGVTPATY